MRNRSSRITALLLASCLTAGTALTFADVEAKAITYDLNIPAEDLTSALQSFALASHHKLLYKTELTAGKSSGGLRGQFTAEQAVARLLAGTGLTFEITGSSVVLIRDASAVGKTGDLEPPSRPNASPFSQDEGGRATLLAQANPPTNSTNSSTASDQGVPQDSSKKSSREPEKSDLTEIVVTGTHIHDVAPISPVITITHDDIVRQGYTTIAEVIEQLPQNFLAGASPASNIVSGAGGSLASNNITFASGINLRGLGPNATLVLLNGRRMAPSAFSGVADISNIPVNIIERIEILTDGASSVYGADAVAGVVNIITRRDFSGVQVDAGLTGISEGKTPDHNASLLTGTSWSGGGVIASADYEKDNPLYARNRYFTQDLANPWELTPKNEKMNLYVSAHQDFSDVLTLSGDGFVARRNFGLTASPDAQYGLDQPVVYDGRANQYSGSLQLDYRISPDWTAALIGQMSKEQDSVFTYAYPDESYFPLDYAGAQPGFYRVSSLESRVDGKIIDVPGGAVRAAIGAQYLQERFESLEYGGTASDPTSAGLGTRYEGSRHVSSAYGELSIPIIGKDNGLLLARGLRVDISGRYDDYSDFGHTSNPRFALEWEPAADLKTHATYSRSFQVPTFAELSQPSNGIVAAVPDPLSASGSNLVLFTTGGNPNLKPETAKSLNFGLTYEPKALEGLKIDASYFSIKFDNEIIQPGNLDATLFPDALQQAAILGASIVQRNPPLAEVTQLLSNPQVQNDTGGPYSPADIKAIVAAGYLNSASSNLAGEDVDILYKIPETKFGHFLIDIDASYFNRYEFKLSSSAPDTSYLNTTQNPLRFRAKANFGWSQGPWGTNARVNYSNKYSNAIDPTCASTNSCTVSSWTTIDLNAYYAPKAGISPYWLEESRVTLLVTNAFNRAPPSVTGLEPNQGYDALNASPLLRTFGLTFTKRFGRNSNQ